MEAEDVVEDILSALRAEDAAATANAQSHAEQPYTFNSNTPSQKLISGLFLNVEGKAGSRDRVKALLRTASDLSPQFQVPELRSLITADQRRTNAMS